MKLDGIRHELSAVLSMAPTPWVYSRGRLECANGNEVSLCDLVNYLNMTFEQLPRLVAVAEAAKKSWKCGDVLDSLRLALAALEA